MEHIHAEHIRVRLVGIVDAIAYKKTNITHKGVATLLGLHEESKDLAVLLYTLSSDQRKVITYPKIK